MIINSRWDCKGVGRVLWLKAFSKVIVESTYLGDDEKYYNRKFDFSIFEERKELAYHITIIEFKRPGRNDLECVDQVVEYMKLIRDGRAKNKSGRALGEVNGKSIRFSCYILSEIVMKMSDFLEGRGFRKTPDGRDFYWPLDSYNANVEIIPYSKLIKDSIRRNKILFDRLFNQ